MFNIKNFFYFLGVCIMIFAGFGMTHDAQAGAIPYDSLIKTEDASIYWYAGDGRRYVFPNEATYKSWFSGYDDLIEIDSSVLSDIPYGGIVPYRPGTRFVKIDSDPKVYVISTDGSLHWITSEQVAQELYGYNWNEYVDDIPVTFFTLYSIGDPIYNSSDYDFYYQHHSVSTPTNSINHNDLQYYPDSPVITFPNNYQTLQSYPRSLDLHWYSPYDNHEIELYCDYCTSDNKWEGQPTRLFDYNANLNSMDLSSYLPGDNEYRVRIRTIYNDGTKGPWSDYTYFDFKTASPYISSPAQNGVYYNYPRNITFDWESTAKRHEIQVQCDYCNSDAKWGSDIWSYYTNYYKTSYNYTNVGDNDYRMRVRVIEEDGNPGEWTPWVYYSFNTTGYDSTAYPVKPIINSPSNYEVLTNYPRSTLLHWSSPEAYHMIELYCDYCNSTTKWGSQPTRLYDYDMDNNYVDLTGYLPGDNQYKVRVKSFWDNGQESDWSDWEYFSYKTQSQTPTLDTADIFSPSQNEVLTSYPRETTVKWGSNGEKHELQVQCDYCGSNSDIMWDTPMYSYFTYDYQTSYYFNQDVFPGDNNYRVRIRQIANGGYSSAWSDWTYFSFNTQFSAPNYSEAPDIISPFENQDLNVYPREMSLTWGSNAPNHEIQIQCDYCNSTTQWDTSIYTFYSTDNLTSYYFDQSVSNYVFPGDNEYRVRIRKYDSYGNYSPWSNWRYFSF